MKRLLLVVLAVASFACGESRPSASVQAAPSAQPTTPAWVADAIAGKPDPAPITLGGKYGPMLTVSTPYDRVADAAKAAKARYEVFTEANISKEMLLGEAFVNAAHVQTKVVTIVIVPQNSTDSAAIVRPVRTDDSNGFTAAFPLEAFVTGNEVRVVYDAPNVFCKDPGPVPGTGQCTAPISR